MPREKKEVHNPEKRKNKAFPLRLTIRFIKKSLFFCHVWVVMNPNN